MTPKELETCEQLAASSVVGGPIKALLEAHTRLRQALSDLYDWQNGPPLRTEEWLTGWRSAMHKAELCLGYPTVPPPPCEVSAPHNVTNE